MIWGVERMFSLHDSYV